MGELDRLKGMLVELGKNKSALARQARDFELLQSEVSLLEIRSREDPVAKKKLNKLNDYMALEGNELQGQIFEKIVKSEVSLRRVGEQLASLFMLQHEPEKNGVFAPGYNAVKKNNRNFA
ncbi:MAG TPA: hypothetical protein VM577_13805 [Anaerovoracaceae bacterium]|nr:hypothetical protein [Anaerovoracaceae bacterium]